MGLGALTVFGASGYTAQALIFYEASIGRTVLAMSRRKLGCLLHSTSNVHWIPVTETHDEFNNAFVSQPMSAAIHLAAPPVNIDLSGISSAVDACISSFIKMIVSAKAHQCERIIYAGSYWQYSCDGRRQTPTSLYSALKNAMDEVALFYSREMDIVNLVLFDSFGPNDKRKKIFSLVERAFLSDECLDLTSGEQILYPIYIDDLVKAFDVALSLSKEIGLRRFWVPGPSPMTLKKMVEQYCFVYGMYPKLNWGALAYDDHQVFIPFIGENLPGWSAKTSLGQGLLNMREGTKKDVFDFNHNPRF